MKIRKDYAEREAYWDIPTAMSYESFVRGAVSTPEQSTSYSDAPFLFELIFKLTQYDRVCIIYLNFYLV